MASTKDVVDHHLKCFGERDLKGILFDYAPGAVLFTPDGPLRGADAMRPDVCICVHAEDTFADVFTAVSRDPAINDFL